MSNNEKAAMRIWAGLNRAQRAEILNYSPLIFERILRGAFSYIPEMNDNAEQIAAYLQQWAKDQ